MRNKEAVIVVFFLTYVIYVGAQAVKNFYPTEFKEDDDRKVKDKVKLQS